MEHDSLLRNRVRELRQRLGLRQIDVAREVGVTRQTVLAVEKGRLNPSIGLALRIARILREPTDYVFFLEHRSSLPAADKASETEEDSHKEPPAIFDFV